MGWRRGSAVVAATVVVAAAAGTAVADTSARGEGDRDGYEAVIRRTEGGVPHISGDSVADVLFGQGWASGEDRTCDLADQVIKVRGERAGWFGPGEDGANVDSDLAWRVLGVHDRAVADWPQVSEGVEELVTAFTDGWT